MAPTDEKKSGDPIAEIKEALRVVKDARSDLREVDGSLDAALRLLENPPEMPAPGKGLGPRNVLTAADLTRSNPNAYGHIADAKSQLERILRPLKSAVKTLRRLTY
ncbi:MAG: hypothetical protein OXG81_02910 [Acidobacteria bacterium]|nr:hypothetical protein [Acidobacteriota bacterium]